MSLENEGKTVGDIIEWYKTNLNNGKIPQEDIKQQSIFLEVQLKILIRRQYIKKTP